jgi:putative DNA primase/helicase
MTKFPSNSDEVPSEASGRIVPIASRRRKQSSQALPNDSRPTIRIAAGEIERIVNEAESALINAERGLYQHSNKIVSVVETPVKSAHGQEVIALGILERGDHALLEDLSVAASFERFDKRCNDWLATDPPITIVKTLKQRSGRLNFPILSGIVSAPTMRDDGSILSAPGYDERTGLLFEPRGVTFPAIPDQPTHADAENALASLCHLLKDFPFEEPYDKAVALSAILTACVRRSLPTAPMHIFDAPEAGSGKSKLVNLASVIALGHEAPTMSQGADECETEKRLGSMLLAGRQLIALDNVVLPLEGAKLCEMLTSKIVSIRVLGASQMPEAPTSAFLTATGNNIVVKGDLVRRTVRCRIDPNLERPEERVFDFDPVKEAKARRGELVAAALTILRAHHVAGQPCKPAQLGSFEEWSDRVRGALLWVGEADPVDSMVGLRKGDPARQDLLAVISQWRAVIGDERVTTSDIIGKATEMRGGRFGDDTLAYPELRNALFAVGGRGGMLDAKVLGKWLIAQQNRIVDGASFVKVGTRKDVAVWALRT